MKQLEEVRVGAAELYREARRYLKPCGIEMRKLDIQLLAAFAAGLPLRGAVGNSPIALDEKQQALFRRLLRRRGEEREPAQYIVGSEEFMGSRAQGFSGRAYPAVQHGIDRREHQYFSAMELPEGRKTRNK